MNIKKAAKRNKTTNEYPKNINMYNKNMRVEKEIYDIY